MIWAWKDRWHLPRATRQGRGPRSRSQNSSNHPEGRREYLSSFLQCRHRKIQTDLENGNLEKLWSGLKIAVKVKIQTVSKAENFKPFEPLAKSTIKDHDQRDFFEVFPFPTNTLKEESKWLWLCGWQDMCVVEHWKRLNCLKNLRASEKKMRNKH